MYTAHWECWYRGGRCRASTQEIMPLQAPALLQSRGKDLKVWSSLPGRYRLRLTAVRDRLLKVPHQT